jgi:hypothetical protein
LISFERHVEQLEANYLDISLTEKKDASRKMPPTGMIFRDPSNNSKSPIYQSKICAFSRDKSNKPNFETQQP